MQKIKGFISVLWRFFPVQLILLQLKKSHFIIGVWVLFFAIITQNFGAKFGIPYLFLSPEYLGEVNMLSYFILGFSIGGFFMAYHLYSYIILGPSFPFLVTFSRPFFKFSVNNSFFPSVFYILLLINMYDVQHNEELVGFGEVFLEMLTLTAGIALFILLSVLYFFKTNVDIFKLKRRKKKKTNRDLYSMVGTLFTRENYWFQSTPAITYQPSYYFAHILSIARAREAEHYERNVIREIFRQNHLNASFFELVLILSFVLLGLLQDYSLVLIPSGASFFLLSTVVLMVVTIFYSWFRAWAISLIVIGLIGLNYFSKGTGFLQSDNQAYGLKYQEETNPYDLNTLKAIQFNETALNNDIETHEEILEKWKIKASKAQGVEKPKLVIVNCSGGGLRAAMWTHYIMQEADERSNGAFSQSTHLITGASGGMVGAAYFRDVCFQTSLKERLKNKEAYLSSISKDLLNSVAFNLAAHDIFLRYRTFEYEGQTYLKDRGFSFENQLNKNTDFIMDKPFADYYLPERNAEIPLMVFSPTIINDGRRLIIGTQPYGFLNGTDFSNKTIGPENVEFMKLFNNNSPEKVRFATVLRMNSTFPYILPMVALPTTPEVRIMDAGIRDNYGTKTTVRYIMAMREWLAENTSGVVLVEIRDIEKDYDMDETAEFSLFDRVIKPTSNFYGNFYQSQEFNSTELLESNICQDVPIEVLTFVLRKDPSDRISLSWHLTQREKNDIKRTFRNERNQNELTKLVNLLVNQ